MTGTVRNFFASGNTSRGFTSLLDSSLQGLEQIFVLDGGPGTGKSSVMRVISSHLAKNGHEVWRLHCPSDNDSLDGIIAPRLKTGIISAAAAEWLDRAQLTADIQMIDMENAIEPESLSVIFSQLSKSDIESLTAEISLARKQAYACFAEALRIHDDWEAIYITSMSYEAADELTIEYMELLYGDRVKAAKSRIDHRFLGAATPRGAIDFVPNLTEGLKRYFIKGRAGSGKSTLLKKIAAEGADRGFDVEIYHCGFDPNSLDMVIVRELGFAIFDSTAPHEYFPDRPDDEIIDMYERCIKPGTDEAHSEAIDEIKSQYGAKMKEATSHLAHAKLLSDKVKQFRIHALNFRIVDQIKDELIQKIESIAEKA